MTMIVTNGGDVLPPSKVCILNLTPGELHNYIFGFKITYY